MAQQQTRPRHRFGAAEVRSLISLAIVLAVMIAALFGGAGTFDWSRGWMFFGVYCALTAIVCVWLWIANPEIFAARSKIQEGTKSWDRVLTVIIVLCYLAILPVSALDDGRFHWAPTPDSVVILGYVLFIVGFLGFAWASSVNRHFEATVRIQTDRGHKVITTGPYAYVRHPMYAGSLVMLLGIPIALGSWWGLIALAVIAAALLWRILDEERFLARHLAGYDAYKEKVRYRLIPHLW
jgi:protein-S-isoprenylcysteine O-methyltransferase Ste14